MKFFCIYTEEIIKSIDGANRCLESAKKFEINLKLYKSIWHKNVEEEAKNLNLNLKYNPIENNKTDFVKMTASSTRIANGITHYKLYLDAIKNDEAVCILEHDAFFIDYPPDAIDDGIIQISCTDQQWTPETLYNCSRAKKMKIHEPNRKYDWNWNDTIGIIQHPLTGTNSTSGYIVGPKAAFKMVKYLKENGIGFADRVRTEHIGEGNLYLQNPQSVVCDNYVVSIKEIRNA